jgi:hypothetical protein
MFFIRHSIRLDHTNKEEWYNHHRRKTNKYDPPITEYGKIFAIKKIEQILNGENKKFTYIYSSPMTRCIETSLEFQKYIYNVYNKLVLIRIENGLTPYKIKDNKILDSHLQIDRIHQRYGKKFFDTKYITKFGYKDINNEKTLLESINNRLCIIKNIIKNIDKNKTTLVCTHSENLFLLKNLLDDKFSLEKKLLFSGENKHYCSSIRIFEKQK